MIANDYNNQLSDTLQGDAVIGALAQTMPAAGNVRFSYNSYTNEIKRAYISGSAYASDRFLVLEGDAKMFNESGTPLTTGNGRVSGLEQYEMNFTDDHNWIYEATVMAQPNARFKLTAKFNNQIQYFYGAAGARTDETTALLLGGSDENKYKMRIVYDFKTNRMIKAFIPSGTISTELGIEADLMIIREHQEDAQQVSFSGSGKLSDVKTVFGAMKFNKWTINNKSKAAGHAALTPSLSRYARDLFYISFPFDVNLSDAFGFGTYGTHWIIEYYDGKGRAKNGFWADSESNWKFVTPAERKNFTMNAFEGYILALDLDELGESSSVWDNDVEDVYVYFPSAAEVEDIEGTNRLIPIDQDGYECTIGPRPGMSDDRRNKDGCIVTLLLLLLTLGVGQMWATYYYRGEKNSWGATEMTDVNGIYSYYSATSGAHQFKISTSASSYDYNYTYVTKNYKQTDVSDIGDYSSNNCYCWQSSAHYILVFNPNTSVNSTNKPIICAATALPSAGFESTDNTMSYYNNVDGDVKSSSLDRTNGSTIDLTSKAITSLYLKAFNTKMYQHYEVNLLGASAYHFYYKIHRTAVAAGSTGFTEVTSADSYSAGSVTWGSFDGSKYRKPTYYVTANQSLLSGLGSGLYTMSYYFTHVGTTETYRLPSTSSKYNQLKWKIPVPDISSPTCTSDGSGAGTNESPFTVAVGEDLTLTVGGSQASSDANSVLYAKFGSNAYSSTLTYKIEDLTSTKQSITVKAKYYNSADDLSGTEETWTIYYQGTLTPSLAISSFTQSESAVTAANSGSTVTINASRQNAGTSTITYAYSTDNSNWTTIASTTSTTQSWTLPDVTSTTTYYVKASMTYESTGYSDTETFTVYGKKTIKVKDTNSWGANFKIHRWGGDATGTDYPGETTNITSAGGQWKQIVLYSSSTNFLLCNGSSTSTADANKTANQTYAGVTDGYCYQIQSGTGGSLTLTSTANCPAKPTVTASAATSLTNTTATINGNISSNGNDAITDYGFYWGSTSTPGTQVSKGTSDKTGRWIKPNIKNSTVLNGSITG